MRCTIVKQKSDALIALMHDDVSIVFGRHEVEACVGSPRRKVHNFFVTGTMAICKYFVFSVNQRRYRWSLPPGEES